jgi:hypothetical protein
MGEPKPLLPGYGRRGFVDEENRNDAENQKGLQRQMMVNWTLLSMMPAPMA